MTNVARIIVRFGLLDNTLTSNLILHVHAGDSRDAISESDRLVLGEATRRWWEGEGADYGAVSSEYPHQIALEEIVVTTVEPALSADTIVPGEHYAGTFEDVVSTHSRYLLPPQCCFLVGLRTALDSRRGRGRVYLPAFITISQIPIDPLGHIITPRADDMAIGNVGGLGTDPSHMAHMASRIAESYYNTPDREPGEFVQCVYSKVDARGYAVTHFAVAQHVRTQRRRALHPSPHVGYGLDGVEV